MAKLPSDAVPLNQKLCLSVKEAAAYSGLPVTDIMKIIRDPGCNLLVMKPQHGKKALIYREAFEEYVKNMSKNGGDDDNEV